MRRSIRLLLFSSAVVSAIAAVVLSFIVFDYFFIDPVGSLIATRPAANDMLGEDSRGLDVGHGRETLEPNIGCRIFGE